MLKLTFPISQEGLICDVMLGIDGHAATALHAVGQPMVPPIPDVAD
jgi:hypothetical protein